jgi:hypothetical protein
MSNDEFKARIFTYFYKNKQQNLSEYKPLGVNIDEETIKGWKVYLILMSSTKMNENHKLLKVCFPENDSKINFSFVISFDNSCQDLVKNINDNKILEGENDSSTTAELHSMQNRFVENTINKKIENSALFKIKNQQNSFIEKSSEINSNQQKSFSIDNLAKKFSIEELTKIKALIKFAKQNKILDKIYSKNGEVKIEELVGMPINNLSNINK